MAADQPTVLVVEDELAQREVLAYNLEADGFRVIKAENLIVNVEDVVFIDYTALWQGRESRRSHPKWPCCA